MKILQAQSYTTTRNPFSVPTHSFINPKIPIPLRHVGPTFSSTLSQFSITCRRPYPFQPKPFPPPPPQPPPSSSSSVGKLPAKVYVGHSVYKAKAVLTVSPRPGSLKKESLLIYETRGRAFEVCREGCVLLQFAPATVAYQYDWNRKQVFSLSVAEMGNLISLGPRESYEFFHDPFIGKSDEDKVRKYLKVEPLHDRSGHMFNISVQNELENINENISIPVTKGEFAVFDSLFNFIMPCLLGWTAFANSIKPEVYNRNPRNEYIGWNNFTRII
ncbi:single-stranded DNA-binding protein WHY1, chloroplastic [Trifolium repens]|nr:single-stranded DNA-binding protein WHY1, chloroplastic [Trifolium repens]